MQHKYLTVSTCTQNILQLKHAENNSYMHYTNILQLAEIKTCTTQISYSSKEYNLHYTNILQLAKNKTCTAQISQILQNFQLAKNKTCTTQISYS